MDSWLARLSALAEKAMASPFGRDEAKAHHALMVECQPARVLALCELAKAAQGLSKQVRWVLDSPTIDLGRLYTMHLDAERVEAALAVLDRLEEVP